MKEQDFYQLYRKKTIEDGFTPIGRQRFAGVIKTISILPETKSHLKEKQVSGIDTSQNQALNLDVVNGWHLFSEQKPTEGDNIEVYYDDRTIVNVDWQDYLINDKEYKHMRFWRACR